MCVCQSVSRSSICWGGPGGAGAGSIVIAARVITGTGSLQANGEGGFPQTPVCAWPDANPQTGSGGSGSGGLVKVFSSGSNPLSVQAAGGPAPLRQAWSLPANADGQRGGVGGDGVYFFAQASTVA